MEKDKQLQLRCLRRAVRCRNWLEIQPERIGIELSAMASRFENGVS
jgi:hypothetical protein